MNESKGILCIGGPMAGDRVDEDWEKLSEFTQVIDWHSYRYRLQLINLPVYVLDGLYPEDYMRLLFNGYEQHCKAVAERNKTEVHTWGPIKDIVVTDIQQYADSSALSKELQNSYTASFLRSCRTCIIPSPFGEPTPLTLSYGKCYKGYLNESMEFVVYAGTVNGGPEKSMGRISNPICILP